MKQRRSLLPVLFSALLFIFVLFVVWYIPSVGSLKYKLSDIDKSLETSYGRERKQQYEYDETFSQIPEIREELKLLSPQTEAAQNEVSELKDQRKKLRERKKELQAVLDSSGVKEENEK